VKSEEGLSLLISLDSKNQIQITQPTTADRLEKSEDGKSFFRFLFSDLDPSIFNVSLSSSSSVISFNVSDSSVDVEGKGTATKEILPGEYSVLFHYKNGTNITVGTVQTFLGGSYVASLAQALPNASHTSVSPYTINLYTTVEPNSVHMLWLLPQYIIMTVAEVMFSVTGLEFSYSQAPTSMKSVIQAAWLLTVAFGNLIVLIITIGTREINEQWKKFFLFAGLIFVDMFIFITLAYFYKPAQTGEEKKEKEEELKSKPSTGIVNSGLQEDGF
jgi:solute carrier family 15 oligopeptide transporter 1